MSLLPISGKSRQSGLSMISLMVGMLLAMIGLLAGMSLYQSMVRTSIETRTDAAQDGQLASAMLSLQLELQSAGFGVAAGVAPHIVLVGAPGGAQSLYWRYSVNGALTCRGFSIVDKSNATLRQLLFLNPRNPGVACTDTANLGAIDWDIDNPFVVAEFRKSEAANADLPDIGMTLAPQSCFPYGLGQAAVYQMVTITADNAARRAAKKAAAAVPNAALTYSFCLPNLQ